MLSMVGSIMKKIKNSRNIYDKNITLDNIYKMWNIIKHTCKNRREVYHFSLNLSTNIRDIYDTLKEKRYIPGKYRTFMIFEPKPRLVMSQSIRDKIVNHFVANYYLIPYLERTLIDSNVATRSNKGSSYAMKLLKRYLRNIVVNNGGKEIYCLKIDISKYFYSIDHKILIEMLENRILDKDVIELIKTIIGETNKEYINDNINSYNSKYNTDIPFYKNNKGLSIGAMTSQFLAIFYLSEIDHYIKEELGCKYYIRYMDDFLLLDVDKERLKDNWKKIVEKIKLVNLKINTKSNIYRVSKGFDFLGFNYKVHNNRIFVLGSKKTRIRIEKNLKVLYNKDRIKYIKSYSSLYGYYKIFKKVERSNFKMKNSSLYEMYSDKYKERLIIIKEGIFYKCYKDSGRIIWYLFAYKYLNNYVSFGNTSYDKVINELRKLDLGYVIVDKNQELLNVKGDSDIYNSYLMLAEKSYDKYNKKIKIIDKINNILDKEFEKYSVIDSFLDELS
jgi:hypothetical protein